MVGKMRLPCVSLVLVWHTFCGSHALAPISKVRKQSVELVEFVPAEQAVQEHSWWMPLGRPLVEAQSSADKSAPLKEGWLGAMWTPLWKPSPASQESLIREEFEAAPKTKSTASLKAKSQAAPKLTHRQEPDTYEETTSTSVFGEIQNAFVSLILGFLLIILAVPMIWFNERREALMFQLIDTAEECCCTGLSSTNVDEEYNGKLVHIQGETSTEAVLKDEEFGLTITGSVRLSRKVSMYQWYEEEESTTTDTALGGKETTKKYTYRQAWKEHPVDSSSFKHSAKHQNPSFPLQSASQVANEVKFGAFELRKSLVEQLSNLKPVDAAALPRSPATSYRNPTAAGKDRVLTLLDGQYTTVPARGDPVIGDLRVTFEYVPCGPGTVLALQNGNTFAPLIYDMTVKEGRVTYPGQQGPPDQKMLKAYLDAVSEKDEKFVDGILDGYDNSNSGLCSLCCCCCGFLGKLFEVKLEIFSIWEGHLALKEALARTAASQRILYIIVNIVALVMLWIGWSSILGFAPTFFRLIPLLGTWIQSVANTIAGLAGFLLAVVMYLLVSSVAWLRMRPLKALAFLAVAGAAIAIPILLSHKST